MRYDTTLGDYNITEQLLKPDKANLAIRHQIKDQLTLHHSEWQAASDEEQYVAFCYHERHYRQVREFLQRDIQERLPSILITAKITRI